MTRRAEDGAQLIDARGLKCPWPVLRAARAMRECNALILLADDPVALIDLPALAASHGWSALVDEEEQHYRFSLSKSGR